MRPGNDVSVYYNENNPFAAAWLRELVKAGAIAPGDVDDRSIEDVTAADLLGYTQCHFFAGIGVWSHALRRAGWPDSRPVWTGSCPCQPFSAAGRRKGIADERHLWPAFFWLISQCHPVVVFGEQVASRDGLVWFDIVSSDMEGAGYTCGAVDTCAAGFGAPHIRQRLYWMAHTAFRGIGSFYGQSRKGFQSQEQAGGYDFSGGLAHTRNKGRERRLSGREDARRETLDGRAGRDGATGGPLPVDSFWRDADWLLCRDGKWRPVEPGSVPLAHGAANRVGRLRGYGNAIVAPQAEAFIRAFMDVL